MKKNFKSLLASAMAIVMTASLLPASVLAASISFYRNDKDTEFIDSYQLGLDTNAGFYFVADDTDIPNGPYVLWNDARVWQNGIVGWSFSKDATEDNMIKSIYFIDDDVTLYPVFTKDDEIKPPAVKFNSNSAVSANFPISIVTENDKFYLEMPNPADCGIVAPEGKEFKCWTVDGVEIASDVTRVEISGESVTVSISWKDKTVEPEVTKYTVTFDANGGTGTMAPITVTAGEDGKFWVTLPACDFNAPDGKFFSGYWLFDLSNTWERGYAGVEHELTGNVTLYAQWTDKFHTVTYYDVNRENTVVQENIEHGSKITMPTYEEMFGALPANTWMIEWHPVDMDLTFAPSVGDSYTVTSDERIHPAVGTVNVYPDGFIVDAKGNVVKTNADVKADFTDGKLGLELVDCKDYTDANVDHWNIYSRNWATITYELISKKEGIELPRFDVYVQAVLKAPSSDNNDSGYEGGGGGGGSSDDSGSSSDRVTNEDGSVTTTTTNKDGSVTEKTTFEDGSKSEITVNKDGSAEFKAEMKDGTTATATIAADGKVEAEVELSDKATFEAAKNNEVLPLPIPSVPVTTSRDEASVITISASDDYATKVEVPVEDVTPGTVVILVDKNGKETIVTKSSVTKDGVVFATQGDVTVKVVDNSKSFGDVKSNFWGNNSVAFVTSRELFSGTSPDSFSPNEPMTRAMIFTVLARLDGQDPTGGANWWDKGVDWAKSVGLTDGSNPQAQLTREQLAVMLYNYSGKPAVDTSKLDKAGVSNWAENAMAWCVSQGVMAGDQNGNLNAGNNATRAEVATMLMSFVSSNNR